MPVRLTFFIRKKLLATKADSVQSRFRFYLMRKKTMRWHIRNILSMSLLVLASMGSQVQGASWIWHASDENHDSVSDPRFFRYTFTLAGGWESASLEMSVDNEGTAYLNGTRIASSRNWQSPAIADISEPLVQGRNVLAIKASNHGGSAGVMVRLKIKRREGPNPQIATDGWWVSSAEAQEKWMDADFDDADWQRVDVTAQLGDQPWGNVFKVSEATAAESIKVPEGFKVERVLSASRGQGSWIAMTFDDQGRAIISPQSDNDPLLRVSQLDSGSPVVEAFESTKVRHAMGLLYAHDSLYINGHGPNGTGLYRWIDRNKDDQWTDDETVFLKSIRGEGEHGYHGLRLGPDGMIYMMNGNHTRVPEGVADHSPHRNFAEDHLLPRQWDANGHATGVMAPGGYIVRTDPEGKNWELLLAGFRNSYDFDFNADGEMFTYDSDMEWDWGTPWYRPTRVLHSVVGGEYGWRSGTSKWPEYYEDSLPALIDVGIGSPTGVCFGYGTRFPERYQKALYVMDWSYGRIFAIHMAPNGASYFASKETFVSGRPLNVSDMEVGPDGALYFAIGGRGTQAGLYRVTYEGEENTDRATYTDTKGADARMLRHRLESFHGKTHPQAVSFAWPHLRSPDRFIRYAARVAIESQPITQWSERLLDEYSVQGSLTALLALARVGDQAWQDALLEKLQEVSGPSLTEDQQLLAARILQLSVIRMGEPSPNTSQLITGAIDQLYPSESEKVNKELCRLAVYFKVPNVIDETLALVDQTKHFQEQLHFIFSLRNVSESWTLEQRRRYFSWFNTDLNSIQHPPRTITWFLEAGREFSFGASFNKFMVNIKNDALAHLTDAEKTSLKDILEGGLTVDRDLPPNPMLTRGEFAEWKMSDLESSLDQVGSGRDFEQGRLAYEAAQCGACHRFGNAGGSVGPELTAISSRFSRRDILDSIMNPSNVLSEQYVYEQVVTKNGEQYTGRLVGETDTTLELQENPYDSNKTTIQIANITSREPSSLSPMPEGLIYVLKKNEILDLLAYLESGGDSSKTLFNK